MTEHQATGEWPAAVSDRTAKPPDLPGYELLEELGRGGMGVVYKARQLVPDRLVALKLLRDGAIASPAERARFRIEADAVARMRHPGIVQVHDVGEHEGRAYLAMELVEGIRLDQHLNGRPQSARDAAALLHRLALAVEHAHQQKIVHRDLKPANILLLRGQPEGHEPDVQPKITDFGLAKRLDSESTAFTQDGAVLGTASYTAPEQAAGRVGEIGPATDIYALGAILYELLTGRPPFRADSWHVTIQQVLADDPAPPRRIESSVPADLETICLKCLEKEPGKRYSSCNDLAEDLRRYLEGKSIAASPLRAEERRARLAERGGYQIVCEIGRGPRSTVYHALHGPHKQPVALKVFDAGVCTQAEWQDRLDRVRLDLGVLTHPQVVGIQEAGWWDDVPFVATPLVPNRCLSSRLKGKPLQVVEAMHLVEQLAEIVGFCHRQGIVHGNLKSSNILLAADGIPRITDFRLTGGLFLNDAIPDGTTSGVGYLAPELIDHPEDEPHRNADIYGLGVILYELLTGRGPFDDNHPSGIHERVRSEAPAPPSHSNSDVRPELDFICLRCLRKNPWRRYARAYDLQSSLRHLQK